MASYLNQNGNSIGSLLRFIQEQKSQSPMVPPSTETGSPIRAMTQEPLKGPEDTGTSKVVSLRPEATIGNAQGLPVSQGPAQGITPARTAFGWSGIGGAPISAVAKNEPGVPSAKSVGTPTPSVSTPSIGTTIKAAAPTVVGQKVTQLNKSYAPTGIETTPPDISGMIAAGDKSFAEGQARFAESEKAFEQGQADLAQMYKDNAIADANYAYLTNPNPETKARMETIQPPSPPREAITTKLSSNPTAGYGTTTYYPSKPNPVVQKVQQVAQKAQQVAQKIAPVITQSPWSWLSSQIGKKTGWW